MGSVPAHSVSLLLKRMEDLLILILLSQFFVGAFHLLLALIRSFTGMWKFSDGYFSLQMYWILVAGYFIGGGVILLAYKYHFIRADWYGVVYLLSAWLIAGYYWLLVYWYLQATAPSEVRNLPEQSLSCTSWQVIKQHTRCRNNQSQRFPGKFDFMVFSHRSGHPIVLFRPQQ